jgi:hypothetical protein
VASDKIVSMRNGIEESVSKPNEKVMNYGKSETLKTLKSEATGLTRENG